MFYIIERINVLFQTRILKWMRYIKARLANTKVICFYSAGWVWWGTSTHMDRKDRGERMRNMRGVGHRFTGVSGRK